MNIFELIILAVGLSMDAFAVSVCKGLAMKKADFKSILTVGIWFGTFQAIMPFFGFLLGEASEKYISKFDHWVAFFLLFTIGAVMIKEAFGKNAEIDDSLSAKVMLTMSVATSIDALAVGISFGVLPNVNIPAAVFSIGIITFIFCMAGVKIGNIFGSKYRSKAEFAGGAILIILGFKILIEHLYK